MFNKSVHANTIHIERDVHIHKYEAKSSLAGVQEFTKVQAQKYAGFQNYLHSNEKIKYVPIDAALEPRALLKTIIHADLKATVIHGRGGVGKSRLLIEIGRTAVEAGYCVLQVKAHSAKPEILETLVHESGDAPLLILMDYVERCLEWDGWMSTLQECVDNGAKIWLVGTCRDSWKGQIDPYQSNLISITGELNTTVRSILEQRPPLLSLEKNCQGIPVFAAFLCFLFDINNHAALDSLHGHQDFGRWLQQHLAYLHGEKKYPLLIMKTLWLNC